MNSFNRWIAGIALALTMALLPTALLAQEDNGDQSQDPPSRVARLNYSSGSVSFQPGGQGDWVEAAPNRPLTTGDNLWTDQDSRAELHAGSTALRMSAQTSVTFLELTENTTQLKLSQGTLILRVRHLDDNEVMEVDTPNLAFNIERTGEYRIDVNANGDETDTTVWHGRAVVTGGGQSYLVSPDQLARFSGTDQLDHEIDQIDADDFDRWAFDRDGRQDHSQSSQYISPEMTGAEDLDDNGSWHNVPEYGAVWTPRVEAGWAPYRTGHWAFVEPWGWTWVEDEPWGFAPFHYGRWANVEGSWCWVPGPVAVRPVYAPALVAFVGGGGFSVSIGVGGGGGGVGVAWFPLGPREVYVPPYRVSRAYVNNVNVSNTTVNVTQVTNVYNTTLNRTTVNNTTVNNTTIVYANQHVNNAVTVVSKETFVNARPVAANIAHVDQRQLQQAPVTHTTQFQPVKQSVIGAARPATVTPPPAVVSRQVVATRTPAPPKPTFEQRQNAGPGRINTAPQIAQPNVRTVKASSAPQPAITNSQPINRAPVAARPNAPAPRPVQPAAETVRPNDANRPNQPGQPAEAVRPNAPTRPNQPGQPNQAARSNDATNPPARANEMNRPNEPARPNQPVQPNQGARPNDANRPNPPNQPVARPNETRPQPPAMNERPKPREAPAPNPNENRVQPTPPARQPEVARPDNRNQPPHSPQNNNNQPDRQMQQRTPPVKPTSPPPQERAPQRTPENAAPPSRSAPRPEPPPRPEAARPEPPKPQAQQRPQVQEKPVPRPPDRSKEKPKDEKPPKDEPK